MFLLLDRTVTQNHPSMPPCLQQWPQAVLYTQVDEFKHVSVDFFPQNHKCLHVEEILVSAA